ncbi:MAG TPA: DUF5666 domain-containing protein [Terriglobales bacterium]|nr:DUF5666 domain-containing protein [Terriglobales bacterium]
MRNLSIITALLAVSSLGWAQDQQTPPPDAPPQAQGQMGGRGMRGGPGVAGTITAISDTSITVKTRDGKTEQVNLSSETKFRKERQDAKLADFKVGDEIFVRGQSAGADTWTAAVVAGRPAGGGQFEQRMREGMGKEFIAGEVTAINGVQLTIKRPDGVSQTISADESTSFRKQQESITLADIKVGDHVFGRGAVKNDVFVPATLNVGDPGMMRRGGPGQGPGPGMGSAPGQGPSA